MSRAQKLIKNTLWSFSARFLPILLYLFTTPYIVSRLGVDAYGIYAMVFLFLGYIGFLNLGLPKSVIKFIAEAYAQKNYDAARCCLVTALVLFCAIGLLGGIILFSIAGIIVHLLKIPSQLASDSLFMFRLSSAIFMLSLPIQAFIAVPKAMGRFDISSSLELTIVTMQTLGAVATLAVGGGLKEVAVVITAVTGIGMLITAVAANRLIPLWTDHNGYRVDIARKLLCFGGLVATDAILIQISTRINGLIIGFFHPIANLSYYTVADSIASRVSNLPTSIGETIFPSFSELGAQNRQDLLYSLYLRATRYIVILTIPFFFLFLVFPDKFLGLWLGTDFEKEGTIVLMVLGSAQLISLWAVTAVAVVRGLNRPGISTRWQTLLAGLNFILCLILIPPYGIVGAAFAWSIGRIILIPVFIQRVALLLFGFESWSLWKDAFLQPILISVVFFLIAIALRPLMTSLLILIATLGCLASVYLISCFFLALDPIDRNEALRFMRWKKA